MFVADPELEDVAEEIEGADLSLFALEEGKETAVIVVFRIHQVRIGKEKIFHGRHYRDFKGAPSRVRAAPVLRCARR